MPRLSSAGNVARAALRQLLALRGAGHGGRGLAVPRRHRPFARLRRALCRNRSQAGRGRRAIVFCEPDVVVRRQVSLVQPEGALGLRAPLEVLVVEREDVRVHRLAWRPRRADLGLEVRHEVAVVGLGVVHRGAGLVGVTLVRPPGLGDDDLHVAVPLGVQRCADSVQLRVEHVGVGEP